MRNTKAQERIVLNNGDVMTLSEALEKGRVHFLVRADNGGLYSASKPLPFSQLKVKGYVVADGDNLWPVSTALYESRMGLAVSAGKRRR